VTSSTDIVVSFSISNQTAESYTVVTYISIFYWPFASASNRLELVSALTSDRAAGSSVALSENEGNSQILEYSTGGMAVYGEFDSFVNLDGVQKPTTTYLDSNDDVVMTMPYFVSFGIIDPEYAVGAASVLANNNADKSAGGTTHHHRVVVGTTVGLLVGLPIVAAAGFGLFYFASRKNRRDDRRAAGGVELPEIAPQI